MVKRNFGVQGTAIGAIESRLPAGLGGFAPCNPPAPTLRLIKSVDEATGIVTSEVAVALSKAMMDKYGEGNWAIGYAYCNDKNELNSSNVHFIKSGNYDLNQDFMVIDTQYVEAGYIPLQNSVLTIAVRYEFEPFEQIMSEYANMVSDGKLYSDWTLNTNGMTDASGSIYAGRPLVTYDGTGYFAKVVAPVGTVVVDGEDSHKSEVWLPADGRRHEVRTTVGFWGKNIYLTKDNIIRCDRDTFVSDSDIAVVDFTSFAGDKGVAVYAAKQAEAQMRQLIADAVAAGKAVIDVNPASVIEDFDQYEDVTFIDPGNGSSVEGGINYDSELNGGCYSIRVIGKGPEEEIEEGVFVRNYRTQHIVGLTVGDCGDFSAESATVETMTVGDCGNFYADYATVETMTVGDCGNFNAAYATVETMTVGDVSGNFSASSATVETMTVGDCGDFSAESATVETMTVGDCGDFSAESATVETMTVGDCGNFNAAYATVETMTVGDVSGNFSAAYATVETMTVGDCGDFFAAYATVETMTLNVTATVTNGVVSGAQFGAIYVPASLVDEFKTNSLFSTDFADIIYPISA